MYLGVGYKIWKAFERICKHFFHFWPMAVVFFLLIIATSLSMSGELGYSKVLFYGALSIALFLLCGKPLNAVYGLMGTSGSISVFFLNLIIFCLIFSGIYYFGFFRNAGISYDVNQPHINYEIFSQPQSLKNELKFIVTDSFKDSVVTCPPVLEKEIYYLYDAKGENIKDTIIRETITSEQLYYQNISYSTVLRNTIITFLMQEPTELFSIASTYNANLSKNGQSIDKQKTEQFHWILIFQVLVGWIFFGVFISLLYNKFRYES